MDAYPIPGHAAREVCAVEIDRNLLPILEDTLSAWPNVTVIHQDILKTDLQKLAEEKNQGKAHEDCGESALLYNNADYYGPSGKTGSHGIHDRYGAERVAQRMQAEPGSREYGALSLAVRYYAEPYLAANVLPTVSYRDPMWERGHPLTRRERPPVETRDPALMFRLIRAAFNQRRKTLLNGLRNDPELNLSREAAEAAIVHCGLDPRFAEKPWAWQNMGH